jgi:hypothetical protein
LEPQVSPGKQLACGHAVCAVCTKQLRKAECPVCRKKLQAGYVTQDINQAIAAITVQDARVRELADKAYARYLELHPEREDEAIFAEARNYSDAYAIFLAANPDIDEQTSLHLFNAFVKFVTEERKKNRQLTLPEAADAFSGLGLQMIANSHMTFEQIYPLFYRTTH